MALCFATLLTGGIRPAAAASDDLAVVIVNQDYGAQAPNVKYALRDGAAFAKAATDVFGVPEGRVKTYANRTATQLRRLLAPDGEIAGLMRGRPKARLFFFYSGHGVPIDGAGYLLPVDVPPEAAKGDAFPIPKLRDDLLAMIGAEGQVVLFLDTCFSGRSGDGGTMIRGASAGGPFNVAGSLARHKRAAIVAAARGDQVAWWDEPIAGANAKSRKHSVFTDALVDALYAAARSGKKELLLADLEGTLTRRLADRLGVLFPGMGRVQTPDVSAEPTFAITGLSSGGRGRDPVLARQEATRCLTLAAEDDVSEITAFLADCRTCDERCRANLGNRVASVQAAAEACHVEGAEVKRLAARGATARGPLTILSKSAECAAMRDEAAAVLAQLGSGSSPAPRGQTPGQSASNQARPTGKAADPVRVPVLAAADKALTSGLGVDPARAVVPGSGQSFRDRLTDGKACAFCPELVVVPAGSFEMGSSNSDSEKPIRSVTIRQPFAVGRFELTFAEWDACHAHGGCTRNPKDHGWGRGRQPVINVSWNDAKQYVAWISKQTGKGYRLLTEAEWEYAARAMSTTRYHFGDDERELGQHAWSRANSGNKTHPAGQKTANRWGLHDMHGNVWEWVEDCWNANYNGALPDTRARTTDNCASRVLRGGSWINNPPGLRSADRSGGRPDDHSDFLGFRVARTITP